MKFILIIIPLINGLEVGGSFQPMVVEFDSKSACQIASARVNQAMTHYRGREVKAVAATCAPKG